MVVSDFTLAPLQSESDQVTPPLPVRVVGQVMIDCPQEFSSFCVGKCFFRKSKPFVGAGFHFDEQEYIIFFCDNVYFSAPNVVIPCDYLISFLPEEFVCQLLSECSRALALTSHGSCVKIGAPQYSGRIKIF